MSADWLPPDHEAVVWSGGPRRRVVHQGVAAGFGFAVVVGLAVLVVLGNLVDRPDLVPLVVPPLAVLAFALGAVPRWLWWRTTRYVLTERALYHRTGVLTVTVTELPLRAVQNSAYDQGVLGTLFGHGSVMIATAGSDGATLRLSALDEPGTAQQRIARRVKRVRGEDGGLPGSPAQWRAVLDEVRALRTTLDQSGIR